MDLMLPPFKVTPAAIGKIEQLGGRTRLDLETGGCSGNTYVFSTDRALDSDAVYGCPGAELIVSATAHPVLMGPPWTTAKESNLHAFA
jgi:Fe-S cluster assembly iron-binding protein IscA